MKKKLTKRITSFILASFFLVMLISCSKDVIKESVRVETEESLNIETEIIEETKEISNEPFTKEEIYLDMNYKYATYSIINDGYATLYKLNPNMSMNYKNKVVAVNAGHGTKGGSKYKTFCHPDFSPKVSGGTTKEGSIVSSAVSDGMVFDNGMTEANANLVVAMLFRDKLLNEGYSVLMIREDDDCRLDNIARTVIANNNSDIHIAIHFDSTDTDKGIFYITPYNDENYLMMEPLKSNVKNIKKLGGSIISAYKEMGEKIFKESGTLQGDLTQISFSTNANVDIELGDKKTELTIERADILAEGLLKGVNIYFEN